MRSFRTVRAVHAVHTPLWLALVAAGLLSGCGRDNPTSPSAFRISGKVELIGFLTAPDGHFTGTRRVTDADGVRVELLDAAGPVDSTVTIAGRYMFTGVPRGAYRLRAWIGHDASDQTTEVTAVDRDLEVGDVLLLESRGDLYPVPNPFQAAMLAYFTLPNTTDVLVRVHDLRGNVLQVLQNRTLPPGRQELLWTGRDAAGHTVPLGAYWITVRTSEGVRAQLVFRD
jgi:hypothetical protein